MDRDWRRQIGRHAPQSVQRRRSTAASLRPLPPGPVLARVSARTGQADTQAPQPVQLAAMRRMPSLVGISSAGLCMGIFGEFQEDAVGAVQVDQALAGFFPSLDGAEEFDAGGAQFAYRGVDVVDGKG